MEGRPIACVRSGGFGNTYVCASLLPGLSVSWIVYALIRERKLTMVSVTYGVGTQLRGGADLSSDEKLRKPNLAALHRG